MAIQKLASAIASADAIVVGAGSGLSTAAGFTYSGPRFEELFGDFIDAHGLTDMYSAGFYPFQHPRGAVGLLEPPHLAQPLRPRSAQHLRQAASTAAGHRLLRDNHQR